MRECAGSSRGGENQSERIASRAFEKRRVRREIAEFDHSA
jgi:hypothetical protein